uniref:Matrix Gla protein n=1 Tax=Fundulus heteroclitus TaxID=8078 RepID=A0A3Q2P1J8_FUNHE
MKEGGVMSIKALLWGIRKYFTGVNTERHFQNFSFHLNHPVKRPKMRNLLQFLALCAVVSLCVCYDSRESNESHEDLFVPPNRANSFLPGNRRTPPRGNSFNPYGSIRKRKSPVEIRAETCEDYTPCRYYAYRFGFQQAYQRYFGARSPPQQPYRPAGTRRF